MISIDSMETVLHVVLLCHSIGGISGAGEIRTETYLLSEAVQGAKERQDAFRCAVDKIADDGNIYEIEGCRRVAYVTEGRPALQRGRFPAPFGDPLSGSVYHVAQINKKSRQENLDYCRSLHPASYLAAIETAEENSHVRSLIISKGGCGVVWLGAERDADFELVWRLWDGTTKPLTYDYWKDREPNNIGGVEDAVAMLEDVNYEWVDLPNDVSTDRLTFCALCELQI